jgi:Fe-S-cluster containining protein
MYIPTKVPDIMRSMKETVMMKRPHERDELFFLATNWGKPSNIFKVLGNLISEGARWHPAMADREFDRERTSGYIRDEWSEVVRDTKWTCIRCGKCCMSEWTVNITWYEFDRIASEIDGTEGFIFRRETDPETGLDHPYFVISGACPKLNKDGMVCRLYPEWFYTCATYPFLLMPDGRLMYHTKCSGIGKGDFVDGKNMIEKIMKERRRAGMFV